MVDSKKTNLEAGTHSNKFNPLHEVYLIMSVEYISSALSKDHYSPYQQFLFKSIHQMRLEGLNYQAISDKLSSEGYKSPTGKPLNNRIVWSIHKKRLKRLQHRGLKFDPVIKNLKIDIE